MPRAPRRLLVAALALGALAAAGPVHAQGLLLLGGAPEVRRIVIEGNRRFDEQDIRRLMTTRAQTWRDPLSDPRFFRGQLDQDVLGIESFYRARGYLRARVQASVIQVAGGVEVRVAIDEGEPVTVSGTDLRGLAAPTRGKLLPGLKTQPGRPLSPYDVDADRWQLLGWMADRGHPFGVVEENVQFGGDSAAVVYQASEGPLVTIGSVRFSGAEGLNTHSLSRELSFGTGDRFSRRELNRTRQRLYDTGLFSDVEYEPAIEDSAAGTVGVDFRMRRRKAHWYGTGFGYSNENLLRFTGEWGSRNFLGTGRRAAVTSQNSVDFPSGPQDVRFREYGGDVSLFEPWLLGTRVRGRLTGFYHFDSRRVPTVEQKSYGTTAESYKDLKERVTRLSLLLEARWVKNRVTTEDSLELANLDAQLKRPRYVTRLATLRFSYDGRNDFLNPSRGGRHEVIVQQAGGLLGGDNNFQKTVLTGALYKGVGRRAVLAGRIQVGTINPPGEAVAGARKNTVEAIPVEDRFVAGGSGTVRGYQDNVLNGLVDGRDPGGGGLAELIVNAEFRFPIVGAFGGLLFLDGGNVWRDFDQVHPGDFLPTFNRDQTTLEHLRWSVGGGVRFNTPVGPVRLEGAYRLSPFPGDRPRDVHIALGQTF